jgi:gamma-glutamylcyclotransferase (GGCT)/AIG2-like uncharacterized protein YtfP
MVTGNQIEVPTLSNYTKAKINHIFVYGTLKKEFYNCQRVGLDKKAELVGTAHVKGYMFNRGSFPAVILEEQAPSVEGELWSIKAESYNDLLSSMDHLESVPTHYYRVAIRTVEGVIAWIYVQPFERLQGSDRVTAEGVWKKGNQEWKLWRDYITAPENHAYRIPGKPKVRYDLKAECMVVEQAAEELKGAQEFTEVLDTVKTYNSYSSGYTSSYTPPPPPPKPQRKPLPGLAWLGDPGETPKAFEGDRRPIDLI